MVAFLPLGATYLVHTPNISTFYDNVNAQELPSSANTSSVMIPFSLVSMQTVHMHTTQNALNCVKYWMTEHCRCKHSNIVPYVGEIQWC